VAKEAGVDYPLIVGGYKALRQAAIQLTEELVQRPIVLIGGCTGNGKTQLVCSTRRYRSGGARPPSRLFVRPHLADQHPRQPLKTTWRWRC
jgi:hypothetical protein